MIYRATAKLCLAYPVFASNHLGRKTLQDPFDESDEIALY
jgi:hypothetical protein